MEVSGVPKRCLEYVLIESHHKNDTGAEHGYLWSDVDRTTLHKALYMARGGLDEFPIDAHLHKWINRKSWGLNACNDKGNIPVGIKRL